MKKQCGASFIEVLIVGAIIALSALVATPFLRHASYVRQAAEFQRYFGINPAEVAPSPNTYEPAAKWLDDEQRRLIQPLVDARLHELCGEKRPDSVLSLAPTTDAQEVGRRLARLQQEERSQQEVSAICENARAVAKRFSLQAP